MQAPFKLSDEMMKEVDEQIAELTSNGKDPHDVLGTRPSSISLRRRNAIASDSEGIASVSEDNPPVLAEDPINPSHYRRHPSGIECIEVTRHMNFNVGNAIKYLWRYMDKGDPVENLKKAQWYLDDEIRRLSQ